MNKKSNKKKSFLNLHKPNWLDHITFWVAALFMIYPISYRVTLGVLICIPLIGIALNGIYKASILSLVELNYNKDGEKYYEVAYYLSIPAWVISGKALFGFRVESYLALLITSIITCAMLMPVLFLAHKTLSRWNKNRRKIYSLLTFNLCLYGFGVTYAVNCAYDYSKPIVYTAEIQEEWIYEDSEGGTDYRIKIADWEEYGDLRTVTIPKGLYERTDVGDSVNIYLKEGLLNIPWYYVGET